MNWNARLVFIALLLSLPSQTRAEAEDTDDFESGAPELQEQEPVRWSDGRVLWEVMKGARVACQADRCELASIDSQGKSFTVEFNSGYGNQNGNASGSGVIIIGDQIAQPPLQPWISLTLRYTESTCRSQVNVPRSLYISMNTYLYRLLNADGTPQKVLTPAQQTMILFYTTILNQAKGCDLAKG
jgi:hypothetical protein